MTKTRDEPAFVALSGLQSVDAPGGEVLRDESKLIAFYLPQFHRIAENSEWWGPGFTEWTNVARGRPNFTGHYQPHIPRDLGFYDLTHVDVMYEQAELARLYGVHGFCFYYYWFSGRRILEKPLENFLKSDVDINFCLCWANENWTRTWDGDTKSVLLGQNYAEEDDEHFIQSLLEYFRDDRYIKVDGKPMLVVYRAKDMPRSKVSFAKWRELVRANGFPGLHIAVVDFYDIASPDEVDADALVEFPPHKFNGPQSVPDTMPALTNPHFCGGMVDYSKVIAQSLLRPVPDFQLYRGIIPSWDNTARRQNTPTIVVNAQPELYGEWLRYLRAYTREHASKDDGTFIFINAWNEWGEGCHLEPDQEWGLQYLEQTLKSAFYGPTSSLDDVRQSAFQRISKALVRNDDARGIAASAAQEELAQSLASYRPVGSFAHKVARRLAGRPVLYGIAKRLYRFVRFVRFQYG